MTKSSCCEKQTGKCRICLISSVLRLFLLLELGVSMSIVIRVKPAPQKKLLAAQRKNRGHVTPKKPDIDLNEFGRLRSCHVLALCGISHSTLYKRMQAKLFPSPDGRDGGLNFWNTSTIRSYLQHGQ